MQDEAILDGDYVLVEKSKTAHNGDIVVALVEARDATLKRFYREGDNSACSLRTPNETNHRSASFGQIAGTGDWSAEEVLSFSWSQIFRFPNKSARVISGRFC